MARWSAPRLFFLAAACFLTESPTPVYADSDEHWVKVERAITSRKAPLEGLNILVDRATWMLAPEGDMSGSFGYASLEVEFAPQEVSWLVLKKSGASPETSKDSQVAEYNGSSGKVSVRVPLDDEATELVFVRIGVHGEINQETLVLRVENWGAVQAKIHEIPAPVEPIGFSVLAGLSSSAFSAANVSNSSGFVPALKAEYRGKFFGRWIWSADAFVSVLGLASSSYGSGIRFFESDLQGGYRWAMGRWTAAAMAGIHYGTMLGVTTNVGYRNLLIPQLYPEGSYQIDEKRMVTGYFKYIPSGATVSVINTSSYVLAVGARYAQQFKPRLSWLVSIDASLLKLNDNSEGITSTLLGLSGGIAF